MTRIVAGSTVVVVGATSGVGRATAIALADLGANLVLSSRERDALLTVAEECGGHDRTLVVAGDICAPATADAIVEAATVRFGHIDTWITTASTLVVGDLADVPPDDILRIAETNVAGAALASRAALRHFRDRQAGVLINVSSMLGMIPNPMVPAYVMTKYAIRGLTLSLHEATAGQPGIRACVVMPGPIDTPMFRNAANHSGSQVRAIPPALSPERVAAAIVRSVKRPRRQRVAGLTSAVLMAGSRVMPRLTESLTARYAAAMLTTSASAPISHGAIYEPSRHASVSGGYRRLALRRRAGDAIGHFAARHL
jgi:short-subunit dehydrogenase